MVCIVDQYKIKSTQQNNEVHESQRNIVYEIDAKQNLYKFLLLIMVPRARIELARP